MRLFLLPAYIRQNTALLLWYCFVILSKTFCTTFCVYYGFCTLYQCTNHVTFSANFHSLFNSCFNWSYLFRSMKILWIIIIHQTPNKLQAKCNSLIIELYNYSRSHSHSHFTGSIIYSPRINFKESAHKNSIWLPLYRVQNQIEHLFYIRMPLPCKYWSHQCPISCLGFHAHIHKTAYHVYNIILNGCGSNHNLTHSNKDYGFHQMFAVCSPEQQNEYIRRELNLSNLITFICFNWNLLFNSHTYNAIYIHSELPYQIHDGNRFAVLFPFVLLMQHRQSSQFRNFECVDEVRIRFWAFDTVGRLSHLSILT